MLTINNITNIINIEMELKMYTLYVLNEDKGENYEPNPDEFQVMESPDWSEDDK